MSANSVRRSSRIAAKAAKSSASNEQVQNLSEKKPKMSRPKRMPAQVKSPEVNNPTEVQSEAATVVFVSAPAAAPITNTESKPKCTCAVCNPHLNPKNITLVNQFKEYLDRIDSTKDKLEKVVLSTDMFILIDKEFELISSKEFDKSRKFIKVIHEKTIDLRNQIKTIWSAYPEACQKLDDLLNRVHGKCHLYGIETDLTADPVYKNFIKTNINYYKF